MDNRGISDVIALSPNESRWRVDGTIFFNAFVVDITVYFRLKCSKTSVTNI
jgi:hypothetical protein